jgi:FtsZ-binding cell division protein ZapB
MTDLMKRKQTPPTPPTSAANLPTQNSTALSAEVERLQMRICTLKTENCNMLESQDNEQHKNELLLIETTKLKSELERLRERVGGFAGAQDDYEATILKLQGDVVQLRSREEGDAMPVLNVEGEEGVKSSWFGF